MNPPKIPVILRSTIETKISIVGRIICGLVAILLIHLILLVNTKFTLWPEMVVYPYLLNNGFLLYKDIINPYPPLFTSFLAIFARIFGYNPLPYQILTWSLILAIDITIFFVAKKIFKDSNMSKVSTAFFVFFSIPFGVNGLWYDLVQTPLILLSLLYIHRFLNKPNPRFAFYSFFFLTIAFFVKQQIVLLIVWFLAVLIIKFGKKIIKFLKEIPYFIVPFLFLLIFLLVVFWQKQTAPDFVFWTLYFPFFQASKMPGYILLPTMRQLVVVIALFALFIPAVRKKKLETLLFVSTAFVLILLAYPRFDYFHLIPSLSVLSIVVAKNLKELYKSTFPVKTIFTFSLIILSAFSVRYLSNNWTKEVRFFEEDIFQAAHILKQETRPLQPIYIQNGPDQLLPLSQRLPPKPWADEFPWYLEKSNLQEKIIQVMESDLPEFIVVKPYEMGDYFEIGSYRPAKIADFLDQHYRNFLQISDTLWLKEKI